MTLIAIHSGGECVGRCDARCYDARHPECDCICGGSNHGKGESFAVANTAQHASRWIREYTARTGGVLSFEIAAEVEQMNLWQ